MKRILHEPAFVLHHYDWSESSLILEVFTRHHGRTALVARGAKRPSSSFRPVLLPLQPLRLNYSAQGEIGTLKAAEWQGRHVMPRGEALLAGYYLNELILRLLARDDAHAQLFDTYAQTVAMLADQDTPARDGHLDMDWIQAVLRAFELLLLRETGVLPELALLTLSQQPLQAEQHYVLSPEAGLCLADSSTSQPRAPIRGREWLQLQQALGDSAPLHALVRQCLAQRPLAVALRQQLRVLLHYHCGAPALRTRHVMMELNKL